MPRAIGVVERTIFFVPLQRPEGYRHANYGNIDAVSRNV
jgi:hypothetical protein